MVETRGLAASALLGWALCAALPAMGQDPVEGVCDDSVRNGCTAGTPNDDAVPDSSTGYLWRCDGQHGGRNSRICFILIKDVVDGVCDESVRNGCSAGTPNDDAYPDEPVVYQWRCDGRGGGSNSRRCAQWFSVVGACDESVRNGCSAGTPNDDAFPDSATEYAWRCDGLNAGANSGRCSKHVPVNGVCNDGVRNGCSAGTPNDDAFADTSNAYLWRCDGLHGGSNSDKCHTFMPVNGVCNDSVRNGCAAGTPNDDAFPDANTGGYVWRCDGEHGGRNSDKCFIRSVNGACDESVRNGCSAGTPNDDAIPDTSNAYLWRCDGLHGGSNSEKCHKFIPVNGVCNENVRNGCSAGTSNDDAIPDSPNAHLWRCDGLHGGENSEKCLKYIPVDGVCDESVRNGCSAGTPNDDAVPDSPNAYLWRCDGLHGGANSGKCLKHSAVDGGWSDWSACSATSCGTGGTQTRTCDNPTPESGGQQCLKLDGSRGASETRACTGNAPANGGWSAWGSCSAASCGATGTQTRTCTDPAPGCGGQACSGPSSRSCTANTRVDGGWSAWTACSASVCGTGGTQTRSCNNPSPACGGNACTGPSSRSCTGSDPIAGGWSAWSSCSATACGATGTQTRSCTSPAPGCGGQACSGPSSRSCTANTPVNGGWSAWGACSASVCGTDGTQTRSCNNPSPACGGSACTGSWSRPCTGSDPLDGGWSDWSSCSATACGESGTQTRTCDNPSPACGGSACTGSWSRSCTGSDPLDGGWSDWSSCSATACGESGTQTRTCTNPVPCDGADCTGPASQSCTGDDPRDCRWGTWSNCTCTESTADASNAGTQSRSPSVQPGCGGAPCQGSSSRSCTVTAANCPRPRLPLFTVSVSVSVSGNTATASAVVSGGTPPYSYSWSVSSGGQIYGPSNGSSITIRSRRVAAEYPNASVTVTDSTGATVTGHSF